MLKALKIRQLRGDLSTLLDPEDARKTYNMSGSALANVRRLLNPWPSEATRLRLGASTTPAPIVLSPDIGGGGGEMLTKEQELLATWANDVHQKLALEAGAELGADLDVNIVDELRQLELAISDTLDYSKDAEADMERFFGPTVKFMDFFTGNEMLISKPYIRA